MDLKDKKIILGTITSSYGLRGYFKVLSFTEQPEQLINYSGILVPFTPEEKQLLLEAKTLITRGHALEALYQSYIFDLSGEKSDQLH